MRVVALTVTQDGYPVLRVYGPYEDTMAASDAMDVIRGVKWAEGVKIELYQLPLEDPEALVQRIQELDLGESVS